MKALITGGTTGIGFGIANAMIEAGYDVTVTGLTDEQVAAFQCPVKISRDEHAKLLPEKDYLRTYVNILHADIANLTVMSTKPPSLPASGGSRRDAT